MNISFITKLKRWLASLTASPKQATPSTSNNETANKTSSNTTTPMDTALYTSMGVFQLHFRLEHNRPNRNLWYIPRYTDYKFKNDLITSEFANRSSAQLGPLASWVMQRRFGQGYETGIPQLNANFLTGDIELVASAPFAVSELPVLIDHTNLIKVDRLLPVYGTPIS